MSGEVQPRISPGERGLDWGTCSHKTGHLPFRQVVPSGRGCVVRPVHLGSEALLPEGLGGGLEGGHELDGADQADLALGGQVGLEALNEVETVDLDVHEDVEHLDTGRLVDWHEATVAIVHLQGILHWCTSK